jgi:hypothetical protein
MFWCAGRSSGAASNRMIRKVGAPDAPGSAPSSWSKSIATRKRTVSERLQKVTQSQNLQPCLHPSPTIYFLHKIWKLSTFACSGGAGQARGSVRICVRGRRDVRDFAVRWLHSRAAGTPRLGGGRAHYVGAVCWLVATRGLSALLAPTSWRLPASPAQPAAVQQPSCSAAEPSPATGQPRFTNVHPCPSFAHTIHFLHKCRSPRPSAPFRAPLLFALSALGGHPVRPSPALRTPLRSRTRRWRSPLALFAFGALRAPRPPLSFALHARRAAAGVLRTRILRPPLALSHAWRSLLGVLCAFRAFRAPPLPSAPSAPSAGLRALRAARGAAASVTARRLRRAPLTLCP